MKKFAIVLTVLLSVLSSNCMSQMKKVEDAAPYTGVTLDKYCSSPKRLLVMETTLGTMKIQLFDRLAPNHVVQIAKLAIEGKYDGCYFHRVIPGFMIQGGDPNTKDADPLNDGMGGMGTPLKAEFSSVKHLRGVCSMARLGNDENSATSQFFICNATASSLNNSYTVWGQVIEGYDVIEKITNLYNDPKYTKGENGSSINPGKDATMTKVYVENNGKKEKL